MHVKPRVCRTFQKAACAGDCSQCCGSNVLNRLLYATLCGVPFCILNSAGNCVVNRELCSLMDTLNCQVNTVATHGTPRMPTS